MIKRLLLVLLILPCVVLAQSSETILTLKDQDSQLPIEDVTVFVVRTKQIHTSNTDGVVRYLLNGVSNLQISHSSYEPITIRSSVIKGDTTVIWMKSVIKDLEEIILTKQHPQKILKSLIENSAKKLSVPSRLKVYTREFFKMNGVNSYYNDGLLNFQISGNDKNFQSTILVEQNRSYGLVQDDFTPDVLGYNLNNIMENYYNFKYLDPLLDSNAKKEYDFLIKSFATHDDYYKMVVMPLEDSKGLKDHFEIIYDTKKKVIVEINSFLPPEVVSRYPAKKAIGNKNIYKSMVKIKYRLEGDTYCLASSREEIGFEKIGKNKTDEIEVKNYFITTQFSRQNFSFKENEVFKAKTLYNKNNVILTNYWTYSGLVTTDEENDIITFIENTKQIIP